MATTDANKFAVKAERQFGVAAMEEIRTAMKCPLPPPPEPQAEPQATPPEPQAEEQASGLAEQAEPQAEPQAEEQASGRAAPAAAGAVPLPQTDLFLLGTLPHDASAALDPASEDTQPAEFTCEPPQKRIGCLLGTV